MSFVEAECTNCGANIEIDSDKNTLYCIHCGSKFVTQETIQNYHYHTTQNITKYVFGQEKLEIDELLKNGDTLLSLEEYEIAEKVFKRAIEDNPLDWRGWFGVVKARTKNMKDNYDTTHIPYLKKAKKVASKQQLKEIDEQKIF